MKLVNENMEELRNELVRGSSKKKRSNPSDEAAVAEDDNDDFKIL